MKSTFQIALWAWVGISLLSLGACTTNDEEVDALTTQDVLFHYAEWDILSGVHNGWFINGEGERLGYSNPDEWFFASEEGVIASADLKANFDKADESLGTIKERIIKQKARLILQAAEGALIESGDVWGQGSSYYFRAYLYDASKDVYQEVPLQTVESKRYTSNTTAGRELVAWMEEL